MFRTLLTKADRPALGIFVKIPSLEVVEMVANAGFDFVVIDTEHALLSVRDVYEMITVYSRSGVVPVVRVTDHGYGDGQRYLDAGAGGILVPHLSTAAEAERTMRQFLFPPNGSRGMGAGGRATQWGGAPGGAKEYLRFGDEEVARVAMIEEAEAVDNIAGIMAAPGVDALFVGPGDLSVSMGEPGGSPAVVEKVSTAIAAAVDAGVPVGTVVAPGDQMRMRIDQGCSFVIATPNDTGLFWGAVSQNARAARETIEQTAESMARV